MSAGLLAASHLMPLELPPSTVAEHARAVGFTQVLIYLGDLRRDVLRLLTGQGLDAGQDTAGEEAEPKIETGLAGRAYQYGQILPEGPEGAAERHWRVPLLDGTERLGALRITTADDDTRAREDMTLLAALIALILHSKEPDSDALARLTRARPMNIAAEMQWNLTPPRSYADGRVVISASMEPACTISGDAYDYATAGDIVHLSVFDAMGHDTSATLLEQATAAMSTPHHLVLDMPRVTFCDSSGLNTLLRLNRHTRADHTALTLVAVPARLRRLLRITGTDTVLTLRDNLAEARSVHDRTWRGTGVVRASCGRTRGGDGRHHRQRRPPEKTRVAASSRSRR
ncbi:STAS domain-containing protein [Streptomyces sp. NPDC058861]|uniref:STAS domain-containing protein n=1 Tax=Streptomyces sp. NPDC058861 TaxID=3346653 RepID=UPI0036C301AC